MAVGRLWVLCSDVEGGREEERDGKKAWSVYGRWSSVYWHSEVDVDSTARDGDQVVNLV